MDFSTKTVMPVIRSERFRTPLNTEKRIGLWVDRTGAGENIPEPGRPLRKLGLYGIVSVESGEGFFYSRSSGEVNLYPGDAVMLFPDEPHFYDPFVKWTTRWIVWSGPEAEKLEDMGFISKTDAFLTGAGGIAGMAYDKLQELMNSEDMAAILKRKNIILEMIHDLYVATKASASGRKMEDRLKQVLERMSNCEDSGCAITDFAVFCGLSETHFRRVFKSYTGRSPKDFLVSTRISRAKTLLAQGRSIKETAIQLGYHDVFYFMRQFKAVTGQSPGKF